MQGSVLTEYMREPGLELMSDEVVTDTVLKPPLMQSDNGAKRKQTELFLARQPRLKNSPEVWDIFLTGKRYKKGTFRNRGKQHWFESFRRIAIPLMWSLKEITGPARLALRVRSR